MRPRSTCPWWYLQFVIVEAGRHMLGNDRKVSGGGGAGGESMSLLGHGGDHRGERCPPTTELRRGRYERGRSRSEFHRRRRRTAVAHVAERGVSGMLSVEDIPASHNHGDNKGHR